jgi:hypothetical protein
MSEDPVYLPALLATSMFVDAPPVIFCQYTEVCDGLAATLHCIVTLSPIFTA